MQKENLGASMETVLASDIVAKLKDLFNHNVLYCENAPNINIMSIYLVNLRRCAITRTKPSN